MASTKKYRLLVSIVESVLFACVIIFFILTIFDLLSSNSISYSDVFSLITFRLTFISFVLLILFPYLMIYSKKISEKAISKYNVSLFKRKFYDEIKGKPDVNIITISQKYDISLFFVKNYLRDQISQGMLKGELKGDIFEIEEGYKIIDSTKSVKQKRIEFMKENFGKFIAPYRIIKVKEIANNFKVPTQIVKLHMTNLLNEGALRGYFESDVFIRDTSTSELEPKKPKNTVNLEKF